MRLPHAVNELNPLINKLKTKYFKCGLVISSPRSFGTFPANEKVNVICCDYESDKFYDAVKGLESEPEGGARCGVCFELRLEQTAKYAKEHNFDYFTTTLSISPHKNAYVLNSIGEKISQKYNVNYLYSDFKKKNGYKRSCEISSELGLYRQDYCGCIFSKK